LLFVAGRAFSLKNFLKIASSLSLVGASPTSAMATFYTIEQWVCLAGSFSGGQGQKL
jgi:hypothetical protein